MAYTWRRDAIPDWHHLVQDSGWQTPPSFEVASDHRTPALHLSLQDFKFVDEERWRGRSRPTAEDDAGARVFLSVPECSGTLCCGGESLADGTGQSPQTFMFYSAVLVR